MSGWPENFWILPVVINFQIYINMEKTSGLGRGLSSLIPNKKASINPLGDITSDREKIHQLPVGSISPNPHQPRTSFDEADLMDLTQSIKEHGIIQPLIVSKVGDDWQLIAGERRLRAAKSLGLETVPAIVRDIDDQKKLEFALIENLQRTDLNPLETATAYQKLIDEFNLNHDQLAGRVGKSRSAVANTLRILNTVNEVQEAISDGEISEGHARTLAGLPEEDQKEVLSKIISQGMNVREAEKASKEVVVRKHLRKVAYNPELKSLEDRLQQALGTKVEIKKSGESGQIVIKFYSEEELSEIIDKLT